MVFFARRTLAYTALGVSYSDYRSICLYLMTYLVDNRGGIADSFLRSYAEVQKVP